MLCIMSCFAACIHRFDIYSDNELGQYIDPVLNCTCRCLLKITLIILTQTCLLAGYAFVNFDCKSPNNYLHSDDIRTGL